MADGEGGLDEGGEIVACADDFAVDGMVFGEIVVAVQFFVGQSGLDLVVDDDAVGEFVFRIVLEVLMPFRGQEGEQLLLHLLLLIFLDEFVEFFDGFLDRRRDVPREDFGQVMEEAAPEAVDDALFAGVGVLQREIGQRRDDEHVPKHRRYWNSRRLRPPLLEAELPAQFHESGGLPFEGDLLDAEQIIMVFDLVFDLLADLLRAADERAHFIKNIELPLRGEEMRGLQHAFFAGGIGVVEEILAEAFLKAAVDHRQFVVEVAADPVVEFVAELRHHLVEDRGLDVRQDDAVEHFKEAAFNEMQPVDGAWRLVLLKPREHVGDDHFMRLLVKLREIHRVDLVVPTADAGGVVDEFNQAWVEG